MDIRNFIEKYCRWVDYYYGETVLALLEKKNYDCIFWENGCSVYEARPVQCSTYPFWAWMLKDRATWNERANECPGMNKGKSWTFEEIEKNKNAYVKNLPLKKEDVEKLIDPKKLR